MFKEIQTTVEDCRKVGCAEAARGGFVFKQETSTFPGNLICEGSTVEDLLRGTLPPPKTARGGLKLTPPPKTARGGLISQSTTLLRGTPPLTRWSSGKSVQGVQ